METLRDTSISSAWVGASEPVCSKRAGSHLPNRLPTKIGTETTGDTIHPIQTQACQQQEREQVA